MVQRITTAKIESRQCKAGTVAITRLAVWLIERPRWFSDALINDIVMLSIALRGCSYAWLTAYAPESSTMAAAARRPPSSARCPMSRLQAVTAYRPRRHHRIYTAVIWATVLRRWSLYERRQDHPRSAVVIQGLIGRAYPLEPAMGSGSPGGVQHKA
jgi:hypothetical protein